MGFTCLALHVSDKVWFAAPHWVWKSVV